ncbi:MAG TPA: lamin tail domain-containing protein, partial [Planctomycetota bacterium]|nr:lamin tail domain-containing protein [Planctomycetota bacterium]
TQGIRFCFESSYVLEPGAYVVVARNVDALREAFGLDAVVGSFEGQLSNDGERITLVDPEGNLVDSVRYEDSGEWPVGPDSLGFSLEKIVATAPSDDPMSWSDSGSIPRSGWQTISVSGRGTSERLMIYAEGAAEFLLDDFELVDLADPETNLLANGAFDSGLDGWTIDGNHAGSMWSSDAPGREERGIDAEALLLVATDRGGGTRNSVLTDSTVPIDRSGDATYRLTFRYRHLSGAPGLVVRMSGSSPSRGLYFQVGAGAVVTPGAENVAARSALPPFVSQIHRAPKEPTSSDEVTLSARVRGDPNQVILEISLPYTTEEPFEIEMLDDGLSGDGAAGDGIWAATVPPQPHNSVVTYRVIARSAVGERTFPSRTDPQGFYGYYVNDGAGDSKLRTFSIILPPSYGPPRSAFTSMNCTVYRECSFAFEGDLWFNVGVRRRGGSV